MFYKKQAPAILFLESPLRPMQDCGKPRSAADQRRCALAPVDGRTGTARRRSCAATRFIGRLMDLLAAGIAVCSR
ncbi:MAG: hypothetical protein JNN21_05930 [Candidatus Accumulibacter sp.]|nr:hypothetical protein [Accumulibacter sp.]